MEDCTACSDSFYVGILSATKFECEAPYVAPKMYSVDLMILG